MEKKSKCIFVKSVIKELPSIFSKHKEFQGIIDFEEPTQNLNKYEVLFIDPSFIDKTVAKSIFSNSKENKITWIQSTWAGNDSLISLAESEELSKKEFSFRPILTKCGKFLKYPMSDYILQHVLNENRKINLQIQMNQTKNWNFCEELERYKNIRECKFAILGYGNIGKYICETLENLGVYRISVLKKNQFSIDCEEDYSKIDEDISFFYDIKSLLQYTDHGEYDFLINLLPSTKSTRGLLDNSMLQNVCPKGKNSSNTVFINVGRGDIIKESSIIQAIEKKWIKKAILDVFPKEPLPKDSKLWDLAKEDKVFLSPHTAAVSQAHYVFREFMENYRLFQNKKQLQNTVNWKIGY